MWYDENRYGTSKTDHDRKFYIEVFYVSPLTIVMSTMCILCMIIPDYATEYFGYGYNYFLDVKKKFEDMLF